MITIEKYITINPGVGETGPYTYTWSVSGVDSGCVTFSPSTSGVITNSSTQAINTTIQFQNTTCLDEATVTLTLTYYNSYGTQCTKAFAITTDNPCTSFTIGDVSVTQPTDTRFIFAATPSGGTGPYKYTWAYNDSLFVPVGSVTSNVLELQYTKQDVPPPNIAKVWLTVQTEDGCTLTKEIEYAICTMDFEAFRATLQCNGKGDGTSATTVCINPIACPGGLVDWSTFTYNVNGANPSGIAMTQVFTPILCSALGGKQFRITADETVTPGTDVNYITYSVQSTNGVTSTEGIIYLTVPNCTNQDRAFSTITITALAPIQIPCSYGVASTYPIGPLNSYVTTSDPDVEVDWSTFQFVEISTGNLDGTSTTTSLGATATFNTSTLKIEYVVPATTGTDAMMWTVCDTNGNCANSQIYAIVLDCILTPTAVADAECAACGETAEHDVLANDTLLGTLTDLSITVAPSNGSAVFNGNFAAPRVLYTPNTYYSGSDTYTYRITNDSGETDTAVVTVTVLCAGKDSEIATCE